MRPGGLEDYLASRDPEENPWGRVVINSEQALNPESRVTLAEARDAFGLQRIRLNWQTLEIDNRTIQDTTLAFAAHLAERNVGRVRLYDFILADQPILAAGGGRAALSGWHQMCTTRMSDDPATGVVDRDCRVHGLANLYIGGSSVFATAGFQNPTYTIVQLALRLGDHLAETMDAGASRAPAGGRRAAGRVLPFARRSHVADELAASATDARSVGGLSGKRARRGSSRAITAFCSRPSICSAARAYQRRIDPGVVGGVQHQRRQEVVSLLERRPPSAEPLIEIEASIQSRPSRWAPRQSRQSARNGAKAAGPAVRSVAPELRARGRREVEAGEIGREVLPAELEAARGDHRVAGVLVAVSVSRTAP